MNRLYILLVGTLLILFQTLNSTAQETTIIDKEFSYSQQFNYIASPGARDFYSNFIIQEIAKSIPKRTDYTSFKVTYKLQQKLTKLDSNHYKIYLEIKDFDANGDILYRGINVANMLIPNEIDYQLYVYRNEGNNLRPVEKEILHKAYRSTSLTGNLGYYPILELAFSDTVSDAQYILKITEQKMFYNEQGKSQFQQHMAYVNDYFLSDAIIGNGFAVVQQINIDNIDKLPFHDIELKEIEADIFSIESAHFPENLNLHSNDPIDFLNKMTSLKQQADQKRFQLNQQLSVLDMLYYQRGNDFMAEGNLSEAERYYNKSLQVNPFYAPAQYQLARMLYNSGYVDTSAQMINLALLKMNPDPSTQQLLIQLGNDVYNELLSMGERQTSEQKFNESIDLFESAKWFCTTTPGMTCNDRLYKGLSQARYGIYHSYLQVAEKAMQNKRLDIAGNYINQSLEYQKQYQDQIIAPTESMNLMDKLSRAYIDRGHQLNRENKFELALYNFGKADSLITTYPSLTKQDDIASGIKFSRNGIYRQKTDAARIALETGKLDDAESLCNDALNYQEQYARDVSDRSTAMSVMTKIKKQRYDIAISDGENSLNSSDNQKALTNFLLAKNLEKDYNFSKNDSLDIFIRIAAKPLTMQKVKDGQVKAWGNKLTEARTLYAEASTDVKVYGLEKDKEIETELLALKEKIFSQECANAEAEYKAKLDQASKQISRGDYSSAAQSYQQAIDVSNASLLCNIDNSFARNEKQRIKPAMEYQNQMNSVMDLAARSNYTECINKLKITGIFYETNRIDTFGLNHATTLSFIQNSSDVNFVFYGVDYFIIEKDYDSSLILLKELMKRNYPVKYTKSIQNQLASKMAIRDKIANPGNDYNINILKYTEGEKYLKYFKKMYKKTWKKN